MSRPLTIVMYHYVRKLAGSPFPDLHALTVEEFRAQLDYIEEHYNVVSMEAVIAAVAEGAALPDRPILLTFDDGLRDHYENVFPILSARGLPAAFFPSSQPILEGRILDVHKIHFVLASDQDATSLLTELARRLSEAFGREIGKHDLQDWVGGEAHRYDGADVTVLKRLLQRELSSELRQSLVDHFFEAHVTNDKENFCSELYMTEGQIQEMRQQDMYFGGHGHSHLWMDEIDPGQMDIELDRTLKFLDRIGASTDDWVMCYPYGATSAELKGKLRRRNCAIGLLAEPGLANLDTQEPLMMPRLDTNDLPQREGEKVSRWTEAASARR